MAYTILEPIQGLMYGQLYLQILCVSLT